MRADAEARANRLATRAGRLAAVAVAAALAVLADGARAEDAPPAGKTAAFHFNNAPPDAVLAALREMFGVQFLKEVELKHRLTLSSDGPVDLEKMVLLLSGALRGQGAAAYLEGNTVRIGPVDVTTARVEMIALKHGDPKQVAEIVNQIFQARDLLRETTAQNAELVRMLMGKLDKDRVGLLAGTLKIEAVAYERLKAVIVRAPEGAMAAVREFILTELDKPSPPAPPKPEPPKPEPPKPPPPVKTQLFKLNYVDVGYMANAARNLLGISVYPEQRINTLIFKTNQYEQFEQLAELIALLDVPESVQLQTYHVRLNNATADEITALLTQLYRQTLRLPFTAEGLAELADEQRSERLTQATAMLTAAGVPETMAREFVTANLGTPYGDVQIIPDRTNNSLLIRTNPKNIELVLAMIAELDRPKRQVLIKVLVAQVRLDDTLDMGLDFVYTDTGDADTHTYSMDFDVSAGTTGFTYSYISDRITAFLRLLKTTARLDVISRPQILTFDNNTAHVEFGNTVPLLQTTQVTGEGVVNSTVRYTDVVTRLEVTPHINETGFVRMEILQQINDISADTFAITENLAPQILTKREAKTQVQVRDGQTVCLGGFIDDSIDETESKVPLLGDIPLLGKAFSKIKHTRVKNELLIFITPYILDTPEELLRMTNAQRDASAASRDRDRPAEELDRRTAPEENPFRAWGQSRRRYTIPARSGPPPAETAPATQPAGEGPAPSGAQE